MNDEHRLIPKYGGYRKLRSREVRTTKDEVRTPEARTTNREARTKGEK